jgi:hypothetical protein
LTAVGFLFSRNRPGRSQTCPRKGSLAVASTAFLPAVLETKPSERVSLERD